MSQTCIWIKLNYKISKFGWPFPQAPLITTETFDKYILTVNSQILSS